MRKITGSVWGKSKRTKPARKQTQEERKRYLSIFSSIDPDLLEELARASVEGKIAELSVSSKEVNHEESLDRPKPKSFHYNLKSDIKDSPDAIVTSDRIGKIVVGNLSKLEQKSLDKNLAAYFESENVPKSEWLTLTQKLKIEIARVTRPKWVGRLERGGELATLSAPLFLKRVHADYINEDGTVENEIIRAIDPELMRAVEFYISKRRNRGVDLGDAEGLHFVLAHPGKGNPGQKAAKLVY